MEVKDLISTIRQFVSEYPYFYNMLIPTKDGSFTIVHPQLGVHYHSIHGALQEAKHVFIEAALDYYIRKYSKTSVRIFEMGFGTGLNALLSCKYAIENHLNIRYSTIDSYPLKNFECRQFISAIAELQDYNSLFDIMHQDNWNQAVVIHPNFELHKLHASLFDVQLETQYDIIYFDAFAPSAQPELWSEAVMRQMYDALLPGAVLVTYCAQGQMKRNMKAVGFQLESIPGPTGKREMTRAIKPL